MSPAAAAATAAAASADPATAAAAGDYSVHYYSIDQYSSWLAGVHNAHYSPVAVLKLITPLIVTSRDFLLTIDTDTVVVDDVCHMHAHIDGMRQNATQMFAMAPEQSSFFPRFEPIPHLPALSLPRAPNGLLVGVNSGVVLFYLERMRQLDFAHAIRKYGFDHLVIGDQSALNRYVARHPDALRYLEPGWNTQIMELDWTAAVLPELRRGMWVVHGNGRTVAYLPAPILDLVTQDTPVLCGSSDSTRIRQLLFALVEQADARRIRRYPAPASNVPLAPVRVESNWTRG